MPELHRGGNVTSRKLSRKLSKGLRSRLAGQSTWYRQGDAITFREAGFVQARSPAELLARHNYESLAIRRNFGHPAGGATLELGCGYGRLSPHIADLSDSHLGVDINPDALNLARGLYPNLTFMQADVRALPLQSRSFQRVVTWTLLQHLPDGGPIEAACAEILRLAVPGGRLIICEEISESEHVGANIWQRSLARYASLLRPAQLVEAAGFPVIEGQPGVFGPGTLTVWKVPYPT